MSRSVEEYAMQASLVEFSSPHTRSPDGSARSQVAAWSWTLSLPLVCLFLYGCNPYGVEVRTFSGPSFPFLDERRNTPQQQAHVRKLSGVVNDNVANIKLEAVDRCRIHSRMPVGRIVTTERSLAEPVWSTLVSSAGAVGLYNIAPNPPMRLGAVAAVAVGHLGWMFLASRDSEERVVDKWGEESASWRECEAQIPFAAEVSLQVRHGDGALTLVGAARLKDDRTAEIPLKAIEQAFRDHGGGKLVAALGETETVLECGGWVSCVRAEQCAALRQGALREADDAVVAFNEWSRSAGSKSYANVCWRLVNANTRVRDVSRTCVGQASEKAFSEWQDRLRTLRMPSDMTTELPRLLAMASEVAASSPKNEGGMMAPILQGLQSNLSKELSQRIAVAQAACKTVGQDLLRLRNQAAWAEVLDRRPALVAQCSASVVAGLVNEQVAWAAGVRCRVDGTRPVCKESCELGSKESCRAVADFDAAVARQEAEEREKAQAEERKTREFWTELFRQAAEEDARCARSRYCRCESICRGIDNDGQRRTCLAQCEAYR